MSVVWHDLECGRYVADLPLWRELAAGHGAGGILDVGAGTGRVALDLAAHGHVVTALDTDAELLAEVDRRAAEAGLDVPTVRADAQAFELPGARFGLILVPMQTIQLLADRLAFLRVARRHLRAGGVLAAALADALEGFDASTAVLPVADVATIGGWRFASQPVAVRERPDRSTIERIRTTLAPDGTRTAEPDAIDLAHLTADGFAAEAEPLGYVAAAPRRIEETEEHVGSEVVVLRAA